MYMSGNNMANIINKDIFCITPNVFYYSLMYCIHMFATR